MKKVVLSMLLLCTYIAAISQNPILLKDVSPGNNSGTIQQIVKTSNYTFFNENDGGAATDRSLYRTDGTPAGTLKLNLTYPGYISTKAEKLTAFGNKIIFAGDNSANYGEIWASDGTQSGTVALERFQPNSNRIPVVEINAMGPYAYYSVINKDASNVNHAYLKRTDGTAAGTSLVYDFSSFTGVPQVVFLTPVNNILYFIVYDQFGTGADQLWRSDGTTAGTYMVYDFTTAAFVEGFIMPAGNVFYILIGSVVSGVRQNTLWKSDGTAAGTAPLKFIGTGTNYTYPVFTSIGSTLYFAGQDGNGRELWKTDGTEAGTVRLTDINPGAASANPINLAVLNNTIYFSANNGTNGVELWKYDGAVASMVEDINPGSGSSSPSFLVESNGTILFQATNGITGNELWITDGIAANTKLVADINIAGSSLPNLLTTGNPVYFAANDGVNGFEVFKYDNSGGIQNIKTKLYVNDNNTAGDVFTSAIGNNANAGTAAAPYASLQYAVSQAAPGAIIYVDAGAFSEQVIIDKGITIIGAGQTLTFFTPPATPLVPAPGPFTEIGLFETSQNIGDVHISGLSINSNNASQNIIIQSGGSVKNCTLLNGNQGIFFRIESSTKTAFIENNIIQPQFIGINCQGAGLTALIKNNTITRSTEYYAGIFAGMDFGPLPSLTITNNLFENYATYGIGVLAASYNGTISLNSFTGAGVAINRNNNDGNTLLASCNWFNTTDPGTVASKIAGTVNYTPFLSSGTDGSSSVGFQPTASCPAGNTWYVNNNSLSGDIFTTAVGNNANAGTKTAPFATIQHAVNVAAANDIIYVDAGTYTEQVTTTKGITITGAGQTLTFILKPATTVAPPGPFTEQGVIQTAQNIGEVNIKDLSITGNLAAQVTPIIIQSGGSVRNCKLQGGNQGLFVRVDAATNPSAISFAVEGNQIEAEYIAVNFGGANISATLNYNTLTANNPGFSAGVFAFVNRITATNNLFNKYFTSGIQISSSNVSTIIKNAFTGTGALAINKTGGANVTANCNWYGTPDASTVVLKVNAGVNYYPWFIDGTDASTQPGFQHTSEVCGASTNIYYVNDNSTSGDLFTTTIGNDANTGTSPTSPLATFGAALTKATPGAVIYMDAGTYTAQDATIDKQVQVIGTNFNTSPNSAADPLLLNSNRNAETIIENTNWIIGANSIYLDGLTFNPLGKQAITQINTTWSDTRFYRNRLRINSNITQVGFGGSGTTTMAPSAIANWNLNIRENRFEKEDASPGITLVVSRYGGVNINNNSFVVTGTTVRTQTAIFAGPGGVVNYLNISNNTFDRASSGIAISRLAIANMNFNKFINTSNALSGTNPLTESSEVGFRNNILDGSSGIFPFINYTRSGGDAAGATSSFTAEENVITGTAVAGTTILLGSMNLIFNNSVLNPSLTVRKNKITFAGDLSTVAAHFIRPIMLRGNLVNALVEKNEINLTGANQQPRTAGVDLPVSPAITLYTDNGIASFLQPGSVINILNNKINGFKHSFAAYDDRSGNDTYVGYGNIYTGVTLNINSNSFTGDSISINNGNIVAGAVINATCNWYGSAGADVVVPKLSANVNYSPWLSNGSDNDVATGFQPMANVCNGRQNKFYVNDAVQTGDVFTTAVGNDANSGIPSAPLETIAAALTRASAGDSIIVDAGIYEQTASLLFNKSITILGSNYLVSPNDVTTKTIYNSSRNTEARITGAAFVIGADNIFIKGLRFSPTASAISQNGNYSHIKIEKTYFDVVGTGNIVNLQGASGNPIVAFDFSITDSRFERTDISTGASINLGLVRSVWIDDNVFIESPVGNPNRGIAVRTVSGQLVESTAFTNNYMKKLQNAVSALTINDWVIAGNKFDSCSLGFNYSPVAVVAGFVRVAGNTFTNMRSTRSVLVRGGSAGGANNLIISDNIINQEVNGTNGTTSIIQLEFTTSNTFGSAIVANNIINISGDYSQAITKMNNGIQLSGKHTNTTIEGNEVNFSAINAALPSVPNVFPPVPSAVFINTDAGSGLGLIPSTAIINIRNNKFSGFKTGVAFYDPSASGITGNIGYGHLTTGATVNINNNSFTNDSMSIDNGTVSQNVNASCNWYGSAAAQNVIYKLSLSTVDIVPWLTNGTDNDVATGFQPVPGSCDGYPTLITLNGSTNVICNGAANGTINITTSYGKAPFTYTWTKEGDANFILHDEDPTGLAPGTYHLAILDGNGSNVYITDPEANGPGTITVIITQPTQLTATITNSSTACSNIATVTADGGTAGYTYLWSNGSTSATIAGVPVGTYTVTVTDANGCTVTASITLTVAEAFNPSASVTNVTCFAENNGIITVTNANGNGQLMFSKDGGVSFENGLLPFSFTNLAPGTYNIAVKDVSGCTGFVEKTVTQPTQLTATISNVRSTCFNQSTGAINVSVSGGVPAYSYSWTGLAGTFSSSQLNISSLAAGDYTLTVRDNNNCSYSLPVTVPTNDEVVVNETVNHVTCRGSLNGSISVSASGGSGSQLGFSYLWNTGSTSTTISNLAPGNYNVRITDNENGCFINKAYTVTQPASVLALTTTKTNATGCNSLGTITGIASGGTAPYSYSINGSIITGNSKVGLYAGDYTVTVTDANGCTTSKLVTITDNGSDEYEGNNSKNQAKTIPVGTPVNARLALATDAADWFKFTAPGSTSGLYSIKIVHPNVVYTFNVYASGNNTPALAPVSIINNGEKHYQLTAGTTYFVSITTASLSFICYNLTVSALEPIEVTANTPQSSMTVETTPAVDVLKAFTYPNPHNGNFTLSIESPEEGVATIEMFTVNGQKLSERKANVVKGKGNTVKYSNMNYAILFYKVSIGKRVATGKIISPN